MTKRASRRDDGEARVRSNARQPSLPGILMKARLHKGGAASASHNARYFNILNDLKAAAPLLGIKPRLVFAIDWMFRFTQPQDWEPGSTPIVWPSQSRQCEAFGVSPTQVKQINRQLIEAGLIVMRDSANRKRFGRRGSDGHILEAYGFDLSPLRERAGEFASAAHEAARSRSVMAELCRRAGALKADLSTAILAASSIVPGDVMASAAAAMTRRRPNANPYVPDAMHAHISHLQTALAQLLEAVRSASPAEESNRLGAENRPHTYKYESEEKDLSSTALAQEEGGGSAAVIGPDRTGGVRPIPTSKGQEESIRVTPAEVVRLAPRLKPYLRGGSPGWPDITEAADWLRSEMGVSRIAWVTACMAMGREGATVAVAVMSARPAGHFRVSPAAYFSGMVRRASTGDLNLAKSVVGLRLQAV